MYTESIFMYRLTASGCSCLALLCSWSAVYSGWRSVVPVHAHLQQLSELWTLKQMVFLPPLPFLLCYPHLLFRVKAEGETGCLCAQSVFGVYWWNSPEAVLSSLCLKFSIQLCPPSLRKVLYVTIFHEYSGNEMCEEWIKTSFQFMLPKLFVFDIFICPAWLTVTSAHREKSIVALLHRSNPFALVTMGQKVSVSIVTIKTRLCQQPRGMKLNLRLHLRRITNTRVFMACS